MFNKLKKRSPLNDSKNGSAIKKCLFNFKFESSLGNKKVLLFFSLVISFVLYILIGYGESLGDSKNSFESSYVLDDLDINILYDSENYEVSAVFNKPYAIISGNSLSINKLKLSNNYNFFIDVTNSKPGNYDVYVEYEGIPADLKVEIYPMLTEVFIREKSIVDYIPLIEIEGIDALSKKDLMVGIPEFIDDFNSVRIRETQENFNLIGNVKGKVDVSKFYSDKTVEVKLLVYDKKDTLMNNINLLDKTINVKIPIEKKITVVNEIIKEEVIINDNADELNKKTLEYNSLLSDYNLLENELKNLKLENNNLKTEFKNSSNNSSLYKNSFETEIVKLKDSITKLENEKNDLLAEIEKLKSEIGLESKVNDNAN